MKNISLQHQSVLPRPPRSNLTKIDFNTAYAILFRAYLRRKTNRISSKQVEQGDEHEQALS